MGKKQDQLNIDTLKRSIKKAAKGPLTEDELLKKFYEHGYMNGQMRARNELKEAILKQREMKK